MYWINVLGGAKKSMVIGSFDSRRWWPNRDKRMEKRGKREKRMRE
jgi:hypothetical protein